MTWTGMMLGYSRDTGVYGGTGYWYEWDARVWAALFKIGVVVYIYLSSCFILQYENDVNFYIICYPARASTKTIIPHKPTHRNCSLCFCLLRLLYTTGSWQSASRSILRFWSTWQYRTLDHEWGEVEIRGGSTNFSNSLCSFGVWLAWVSTAFTDTSMSALVSSASVRNHPCAVWNFPFNYLW